MKKDKLLQYSNELALLSQLKRNNEITEKEYYQIKDMLMKEYGILSDITAMTA